MTKSRKVRSGLFVATCALAGAAAGIAGSAAAPTHHGTARLSQAGVGAAGAPGARPPRDGDHGGHAVHADEVSLNKAGTAFITVTEDNGLLKAVSGSELTITEGTKTVTYKDVTITLPTHAMVMRNGAAAKASDLKAGDHVHLSQSAEGTTVFAADASFRPPFGFGGPGPGGHLHLGPPPAAPSGM